MTNVKRNVTKGTTLSTGRTWSRRTRLKASLFLPVGLLPSFQHLMWVGITSFWKLPQFPGPIPSLQFHCVGLIHLHARPSPSASLPHLRSFSSLSSLRGPLCCAEGSATTEPLAPGDGASSCASLCKQFSQDLAAVFNRAGF